MAATSPAITQIPVPSHVPSDLVRTINLYDGDDIRRDPFGTLSKLHEGPRIFWNTVNPRHGGAWVVTRAEDIRYVLNTPELFSSKGNSRFSSLFGEAWPLVPFELDPPEHGRFRAIMNSWFLPSAVAKLENKVRQRAIGLIEPFAASGGCEFMESFGEPFPIGIFIDLMGFPEKNVSMFLDWEKEMIRSPYLEIRGAAARSITDYMRGWIAERRLTPRDDLTTLVIQAKVDGRSMSDDEVLGMCVLLFLAGLDTVASSLGFQFLHLATHPELQQRLRNDPGKIKHAVDELLRVRSPVTNHRVVTQDTEVAGIQMKAGDWIAIHDALGSLDPDEFASPLEVDIDRKANRHLAFAFGPHFCVASHLARQELNVAIEEWLARVPAFRVPNLNDVLFRGGGVLQVGRLELAWEKTACFPSSSS